VTQLNPVPTQSKYCRHAAILSILWHYFVQYELSTNLDEYLPVRSRKESIVKSSNLISLCYQSSWQTESIDFTCEPTFVYASPLVVLWNTFDCFDFVDWQSRSKVHDRRSLSRTVPSLQKLPAHGGLLFIFIRQKSSSNIHKKNKQKVNANIYIT